MKALGFVGGALFGAGISGLFWCVGEFPIECIPFSGFAFAFVGLALAVEISSRQKPK